MLRDAEKSVPLHMRIDHAAKDLSDWAKARRNELTDWERQRCEAALYALETLAGSIKTRQMAKAGDTMTVATSHLRVIDNGCARFDALVGKSASRHEGRPRVTFFPS